MYFSPFHNFKTIFIYILLTISFRLKFPELNTSLASSHNIGQFADTHVTHTPGSMHLSLSLLNPDNPNDSVQQLYMIHKSAGT